jgi:hypothetical protein
MHQIHRSISFIDFFKAAAILAAAAAAVSVPTPQSKRNAKFSEPVVV